MSLRTKSLRDVVKNRSEIFPEIEAVTICVYLRGAIETRFVLIKEVK
jgi:hypothetical protein